MGVADRFRIFIELLALQVEGGEIEDCGHYVIEKQPEVVSRRLLDISKRVESTEQLKQHKRLTTRSAGWKITKGGTIELIQE